jgi:hypothetical protein
MAIGSGLAAQFGGSTESTRNTYVAPTIFWPGKFKVNQKTERMPLEGSAAGRHTAPEEQVTKTWVEGSYEGIVLKQTFGRLFMHMFGTTVTPVQQAATTAYLQSHIWADNFGKYMSIQEGEPNRLGTVTAKTGTGVKIKSMEFSCTATSLVTVKIEFVGAGYTQAQTLATATYSASRLGFSGPMMDVQLGTFGSTATVTGVRGYTIKFERPISEDFYGGSAVMAEGIYNDSAKISGTLDVDLVTLADFQVRATAHTSTSLTIAHIGDIIQTIYPETLRFRLPKVYFGDDDFGIDDNGITKSSVSFEAFDVPGTGMAFLDYISTDTAV